MIPTAICLKFLGEIIFVYWGPFDTAASQYQQRLDYRTYKGSFDKFVEDAFLGSNKLNWISYHRDWFVTKRKLEILYVKYEDLTKDK